jgi:RNA recognition motif-containing protein
MKIRVNNLSRGTTEEELTALFAPYGKVEFALIPFDAVTLKQKRYGLVLMDDAVAGQTAVDALEGIAFKGNTLRLIVKPDLRKSTQKPQQRLRKRIPYRKP